MPQFGLRGVYAAKYNNTNGVISYTGIQHVGDAISANIELSFAEGRLYAEDVRAEYMRKATGGTISIGVKYIKQAAQTLMFGVTTESQTVGGQSVTNVKLGGNTEGDYVGIAFYSPDMVDGAKKFSCVLVKKALFGPPSLTLQTMGESITFQTPTTTGELMGDDSTTRELIVTAVCDTEAAAKAWVQQNLGGA